MFESWRRTIYGFNTGDRRRWVEAWAARIPNGARVLDAGAGRAPYRSLFHHCDYKAQDFGQEPATIGEYTALDFECDITSIPVGDGSFDVVLCSEVLEHLYEPLKAVREFARILAPNGLLLLTAPLGSSLHQEPYHYYGGFTSHWYTRVLSELGFADVSIQSNRWFFSLFAQEAEHFHNALAPVRTRPVLAGSERFLATILWAVSYPWPRILGPIGYWLDKRKVDIEATVGYHVSARKARITPKD